MTKLNKNAIISVHLYNSGWKVSAVAQTVGCSEATVYNHLKNNNVKLRTLPNWGKYRKVAHERNVLANAFLELKSESDF